MGLISGIIGAFGARKSGKAAKKAAGMNAKLIQKRTDVEVLMAERAAIKGLGATLADVGASGLAQAGSAAELIREGVRSADEQQASIKEFGALEQQVIIAGGKAADTASKFAAAGSVISGIENTAAAFAGSFG